MFLVASASKLCCVLNSETVRKGVYHHTMAIRSLISHEIRSVFCLNLFFFSVRNPTWNEIWDDKKSILSIPGSSTRTLQNFSARHSTIRFRVMVVSVSNSKVQDTVFILTVSSASDASYLRRPALNLTKRPRTFSYQRHDRPHSISYSMRCAVISHYHSTFLQICVSHSSEIVSPPPIHT